jgi:SAM-dependent methyltransferase
MPTGAAVYHGRAGAEPVLSAPRNVLSALRHPTLYVLAQRLVGADRARRECIAALGLRPAERLLDLGCGPAYYLDVLPAVDYHGFDTDARYIAHARARWGRRAHFRCEAFGERHLAELERFDAAMLLGLLHHLDDAEASALLGLVARALGPSGRAVALDTFVDEQQSFVARFLAERDRGRHVRHPRAFVALAEPHFARIEERRLGDTLRTPAAFFMMLLAEPRPGAAGRTPAFSLA